MICPNKNSEQWKSLVKDLELEFGDKADDIAKFVFFKKGDVPTIEEAKQILSGGRNAVISRDVRTELKSFVSALKQGKEEGFLAGAMNQGRKMAREIADITKGAVSKINDLIDKVKRGLLNESELKAKIKELGYERVWLEAEARLAGEISGKASGRKEGRLDERKTALEFADRVSEYLKTNEKLRGKLSDRQVDAIARRAAKIGTSERSYAKFTEYVDKIIANENYEQQVRDVQKLQSKAKKTFAESESFMNRAKRINVEDLSQEDLDVLNKILVEYNSSQKNIKSENYMPFDLAKNEPLLSAIEKNVSDKMIADMEAKYQVYGLDEEQAQVLDDYMMSDNPDLYFQNLEEAKQKALRDNVNQIANYSQLGLSETLPENQQFFLDNYGEGFVNQLKEIANADLSKITNLKDLAEIVKTIDNSITNKTNSNIGNIHAKIKAAENMPILEKVTSTVKKFVLKNFGKFYYDTPIILKGIFGDRKVAAAVRYYTGWDGIVNAASKAEVQTYALRKSWDSFRKSIGLGNSANEDAIMGVYSRLNDVRIGKEDFDFLNEKRQLESSIDLLLKSDKQENKDFGIFLKDVYERSVKNAKTHAEFVQNFKNDHPLEVQGVDWVSENMWKKNEKDFRNHAESNLNRTFDGDSRNGYHPKRYTTVRQDTKVGSPDEDVFEISSKKPQETGRDKDRILEGTLPDNKVVDYRFEYNTFKNHQEILFEMGSYHDKLMFYKMAESGEQWDNLFGGNKNASFVSQTAEQQYKILRYGKKNSDRLSRTWFVSVARTLKNIGSAVGLARFSQVISQSTPGINTFFQAPKYLYDVMTTKGMKDIGLINETSLGARGLELGSIGRSESTESLSYDKLQRGMSGFLNTISKATGKAREFSLTFLSKTDVAVAKKSFLAFYLKYMNEVKGIKITAADLPTEHLKLDNARREAISYAQQAVDELQGVSNKALLSELKRNDSGEAVGELARTVLMPFNNFASNTRARLMEDTQKAIFGNSSQRKEALGDILGTSAEAAAFSAVNAFVVTGILRYGVKSVMASAFGIDTEKEDTDKIISDKFREFYTGFSREMLVSGFGGIGENVGISALNHLAYVWSKLTEEESGKNYYEWLKEEPLFKPQFKPPPATEWYEYIANNTGGYGIGFRTGIQSVEDILAGITGKATSRYGYDKYVQKGEKETASQFSVKEKVELDPEDKNFFMFLGIMEGMSVLGVSEQDIMRSGQALKYQILRKNKTSGGGPSPFSKGLGSKGIGSKGLN